MALSAALPDLTLRSVDASWNRARWEQLPDDGKRYEVIDGVLYMTTAPSNFHQWIYVTLRRQINDSGVGFTFLAPIGVFMPGCDPVQPDVVVVRATDRVMFQERHIVGVPALLVEVLSPSNAEQEMQVKRDAYARAGVPEYWMVRPATRDVVVCSRPDVASGEYLRSDYVAPDDELVSPTLPVRTAVAAFFAGAPDTTL
ncbi:MAG TPA: Uma2 family endonuclease [Herpetosiphonaceae bacterium]|nr:Uma2 family endonuclease [Herpetosiphonaceae bacterium]